MSFTIPRQNLSEMVLYIWKIINLPYISFKDLLYRISFELCLFNPKEAKEFIEKAIQNQYFIQDNDKLLLSKDLISQFQTWQNKRKLEIKENINSYTEQITLKQKFDKNDKEEFNILLKAFTDKSTLNRAVSVSESAFNLKLIDMDEGLIEGNVKGSEVEPYNFMIDLKKKELTHNCHDFQTRKAKNKKFCKHLVRLFLLLKEMNKDLAILFLKNISDNVQNWDFS